LATLHASINAWTALEQGFAVKKSIVALFIALALIVLISPAIVGRLAEQSMDESLDWATQKNQNIVVTSEGFDRGWFSSAGRHRVEVQRGQLHDVLVAFGDDNSAGSPTLIFDTRLDHGLIPVSSMVREGGTLMPGLGSAISTLSIELGDGTLVDLPGVIHSTVGLAGELKSHYVLSPGSEELNDVVTDWGAVEFEMTTSPAVGDLAYAGLIESLEINSASEYLELKDLSFAGSREPSPFGYALGSIDFELGTLSFETPAGDNAMIGPISVKGTSSVDGDRVSGHSTLNLESQASQQGPSQLGFNSIKADVRFVGLDGAAVGDVKLALENATPPQYSGQEYVEAEREFLAVLAAGFELHIDQLDIVMPQGPVTSSFTFVFEPGDPDNFNWTSVLLTLDGTAALRVPNELVELAVMMTPEVNTAIAMGVLKKNGDFYEMEAAYKKGLLTINGAPMPIPLPGTY
jgi:uncharacterized protein YdgA (DUF945 family)